MLKTKYEKGNKSECCSWTCSGNLNETCGGALCNSVYAINNTLGRNLREYLIKHEKSLFVRLFSFHMVLGDSTNSSNSSSVCLNNPCGHGGTCIANLSTSNTNGSYKCQCPKDRIGFHCEHRKYNRFLYCLYRLILFQLVDPCRFPNVCSHGNCLSFPENGSFACQCRSDTCSTSDAVCDVSKTTTLTCKCPPHRYGDRCQLSCPCQNGGRCIIQKDNSTTICQCDESRFFGNFCENISPCASQPCYMGGTCERNGTQFVCKCQANRIGSQCEKNDPCQENPCIGYVKCPIKTIKLGVFIF